MNTYAYVSGNPITNIDPKGLANGSAAQMWMKAPATNTNTSVPSTDDPCVVKFIHDNYGDTLGFIATIGNLQQLFPSTNPDWQATDKEAAQIALEKTAASKGPLYAGKALVRATPGSLAVGNVVGSGMATFGGLASGVIDVAAAVLTPFGTTAMAMAQGACTCKK